MKNGAVDSFNSIIKLCWKQLVQNLGRKMKQLIMSLFESSSVSFLNDR